MDEYQHLRESVDAEPVGLPVAYGIDYQQLMIQALTMIASLGHSCGLG